MDFYDFYLKYKRHFEDFQGIIKFSNGRKDFLKEYSFAYYNFIAKKENNPCFILYTIVQKIIENKMTEAHTIIKGLNGDFADLFLNYQFNLGYTYKILVCSRDVSDNDENEVYDFLQNHFKKSIIITRELRKEIVVSHLIDFNESILILLGHGNDINGISVQAKEGDYYLKDDICKLPILSGYLLLSCAYQSIKSIKCFKEIKNIILANNSIGPTHQVAFTSFFCKALDIGFDIRTAFVIAEIGCSTYFYTTTGTELYFEGNKREKFN